MNKMKQLNNIIPHDHAVLPQHRESQNGHKGRVVLFTGLSGSGKSTLASAVEKELHENGVRTFLLDGDNVRAGLNEDLGFDEASRIESIRRIAFVSHLMKSAGLVVLCAFVSPYRREREFMRQLGDGRFSEVYLNTSLEECERRDVKGLYARARKGEIEDFTGISAPYEKPNSPDLEISTQEMSLQTSTSLVVSHIQSMIALNNE